jgi:hypothetical protein
MTTRPHDALFKTAFEAPADAAALLRELMPAAVQAAVAWETLDHEDGSFVDDTLADQHSDRLFFARLRTGSAERVYFLLEHQSTGDPTMPLRVLSYQVRIWDRFVKDVATPGVARSAAVVHRGMSARRRSARASARLVARVRRCTESASSWRIVVVDANVGRAINTWRMNRGPKTYAVLARRLIAAADQIDLSRLRSTLPRRSPRLVQQAVYLFRSRSNRTALGDACAAKPCSSCPSRVCPFHGKEE